MSEQEYKITQFRTGVHDIDPATDLSITSQDIAGNPIAIEAIRPVEESPEHVAARVLLHDEAGQLVVEEALVPKRLHAANSHTIEFVRENKGKLIVIGSAVVTIAAGAGLVVRRARRKSS